MQRGYASGVEDGHRLRDDGDAGFGQEARSAFDDCGIEDALHPVAELAGEQGGSFDRYRLRQQKHVPRAGAARAQECAATRLAEQDADKDRSADRRRDFRVAADERDTAVDAGIAQLPEVGFDLTLRRSGGQERGHHHPAWLRTKAGEIVGVDVDEVLRRTFAREGDRIGLDDQRRGAQVDGRRVATDAGADDDGRIDRAVRGNQASEQLGRQLAHRQTGVPLGHQRLSLVTTCAVRARRLPEHDYDFFVKIGVREETNVGAQ